jgi:prepilin-type N-terminal cleavage/methylation domain-containing protein
MIPLPRSRPDRPRRGMTLIEMLVALAATLVVMAAIAQAFAAFGNAVSGSRSVLELDSRMRAAAWRLRSDLAGATARPLPPLNPAAGEGYLEIIEGPATDYLTSTLVSTTSSAISGDHDDALLLTTRSAETPFIGRAPGGGGAIDDTFESTLAEVGWFARATPNTSNPVTYTLYRKQLLVMGYVGTDPFTPARGNSLPWSTYGASWSGYFNSPCDVSARLEATTSGTTLYPNTLADLTRRECRFLHNPLGATGTSAFPFVFAGGNHQAASAPDGLIFEATQRQGEDVVLTNVLAFDVRVFDPTAPVFEAAGSTALAPGDPGFMDAPTASGAYVDLGTSAANSLLSGIPPHFSGNCQARSKLNTAVPTLRIYDTWSLHYEADGLDQDGDGVQDDGTNGLDDDSDGSFDEPPYDGNGDGVFEDLGEAETLPPYPYPLRGIEVRIRCYEPSTMQVRQVTVRHTFVPH